MSSKVLLVWPLKENEWDVSLMRLIRIRDVVESVGLTSFNGRIIVREEKELNLFWARDLGDSNKPICKTLTNIIFK